jgi:prenyltransferase beta subunit
MTLVDTAPHAPRPVGLSAGEADLWCTYAAVRSLRWLKRIDTVVDPVGTADYLRSRRNAEGGYAWTRGMASDAWATFYCTQALRDLGEGPAGPEAIDPTARWLDATWTGEAYGMQPGQHADVWATHFSVHTQVEVTGRDVPDPAALDRWLARLQGADGGLAWTPEHAAVGRSDVRACYYGVIARAKAAVAGPPPWDLPALLSWLRSMQDREGGFRLHADAATSCLWATYRATGALRALDADPGDPVAARNWIRALRGPTGAFVRWPGYDQEDVWASFCAVGSLVALNAPLESDERAVIPRLASFACPSGGYTYVTPDRADDALTVSAVLLREPEDHRADELRCWLEGCRLPNEGGVMYMPGRGAEVRCTLWALAAGAYAHDAAAREDIAGWVSGIQNPDGGFGYWEGRGSDLVSTVSALEILRLVGADPATVLDTARLRGFVAACQVGVGYANVPGGLVRLRPGLHARRVLALLGDDCVAETAELLSQHEVRGGGYADDGARIPDLLSTYEAAVTAVWFGLPINRDRLRGFVARVHVPGGVSWSPMAPQTGGPLAECLGARLDRWLTDPGSGLPALTLS